MCTCTVQKEYSKSLKRVNVAIATTILAFIFWHIESIATCRMQLLGAEYVTINYVVTLLRQEFGHMTAYKCKHSSTI